MVLLPSRTVLIAFLTIVLNYFNYICYTTYLADSAVYLVGLETVGLETKDMWLITHTNKHTHTHIYICVCVLLTKSAKEQSFLPFGFGQLR